MKNKIISIFIVLMFLFTSLISVDAIARTPRIDLDEYQLESTDIDNVYATGTITIGVGQLIGLYDSTGTLLYNFTQVANSNDEEDFKIKIPAQYLSIGANTFKIKSLPIKGVINSSNSKTINVKIKSTKKDQVINASNLNLKIGESKNVNATVDSNLPLTYVSENPNIATVDSKGKVVGRSEGTTRIVISQIGNGEYSPANKKITVVVSNGSSSGDKKTQSITTNFDKYQFGNIKEKKAIKGKASSGLKLTYKSSNSKVATVNSTGVITAKKAGTATITITQNGNSTYKATSKKVTITVPKIKDRRAALQPWYDSMTWAKNHMKYAEYNWGAWSRRGKTLKAAKSYGTCCTYPCVVAVHLKLIKDGKDIGLASGEGYVRKSTAISAMKSINKNYWSWYSVNSKTTKSLVKSGKVLPGDVLGANNHVFIYTGKNKKGKLLYSHSGKQVGNKKHSKGNSNTPVLNKTSSRNDTTHKVKMILRVNTFDVKTSCENGTVTQSNKYMASQNIKITYKPISGKKLKSIEVDGKKVSVKKYKDSYTFNKLDKNHTIKIVYN